MSWYRTSRLTAGSNERVKPRILLTKNARREIDCVVCSAIGVLHDLYGLKPISRVVGSEDHAAVVERSDRERS
jgi:hypothetical protein